MREYLFRGKRVDNGEWVEGFFVNLPLVHYNRTEPLITSGKTGASSEIDLSTVGQYTCMKDKNGKRIFEGDVVNFKTTAYSFERCYIRWHEKTAQFVVTEKNCIRTYPIDRDWEFEIIGNVHDNPELLGGKAK